MPDLMVSKWFVCSINIFIVLIITVNVLSKCYLLRCNHWVVSVYSKGMFGYALIWLVFNNV